MNYFLTMLACISGHKCLLPTHHPPTSHALSSTTNLHLHCTTHHPLPSTPHPSSTSHPLPFTPHPLAPHPSSLTNLPSPSVPYSCPKRLTPCSLSLIQHPLLFNPHLSPSPLALYPPPPSIVHFSSLAFHPSPFSPSPIIPY